MFDNSAMEHNSRSAAHYEVYESICTQFACGAYRLLNNTNSNTKDYRSGYRRRP